MGRNPLALTGLFVPLLPLIAYALSNPRSELLAAMRARPDLNHGAELFRSCRICHGPSGGGTLDGGVPRIAGQHYSVLAKQLVDYRDDRRWDIRMEHFADRHHLVGAQAVADVAGYVSTLAADTSPGVGSGELVEHGGAIYVHWCQSCHGRRGEGDAKGLIPKVGGQHYDYLTRQIYDAVDGRRPNFSRAHIKLFARMDRDDIVGVADFLSRMQALEVSPQPQPAAPHGARAQEIQEVGVR